MTRRIAQLLVRVFLYGIGIAFLVRSALGTAPWDVLTQGITRHVPLSFGVVTTIISAIVLLLWISIRQKPGMGTIVNGGTVGAGTVLCALLVGPLCQFFLRIFSVPMGHEPAPRTRHLPVDR